MYQMQPIDNPVLNRVQNAYKNHPMQTLALGMGVVMLAPAVLPLMKPLAKAALKSGVGFYEKTKGAIAETGEVIGDIVAEAKAEAAAEQAKKITMASGLMSTANTSNDTQEH